MRKQAAAFACALAGWSATGAGAAGPPAQAAAYTVVLDAAHGGPDTGTIFSPQLLEKNLVLALSIHLRSALTARGMAVVTTREGDVNPAADTRAAEANHANAGACLVLHATAGGSGLHLYTSSLAQSPAAGTGLKPWKTAGAPFVTASLELASEIARSATSAGIPYTLGTVRMPPLDAMECPAVIVEVAPLRSSPVTHGYTAIDNSDYEGRVTDALAAALVAWRAEHPRTGATQ